MKSIAIRLRICAALVGAGLALPVAAAQCGHGAMAASSYKVRSGALTEQEMDMARIAWKYFENNYQPDTGLVNAVDGYPSTTMWDTASYMAALAAAHALGIIGRDVVDKRLAAIVKTLNELDFFRGELPNKVYNAKTKEKADYTNKPGEIGFSAIDLGRMLIWLDIIKNRYPEFADGIDRFVMRWRFENVIDRDGIMFGANLSKEKKVQYLQEGRLGYEEYAAKGFQLWGFQTKKASEPEPYETIPLYCIQVPYDSRDPRKYYQHNYVVTESYVLAGIEFDWDSGSQASLDNVRYGRNWMRDFADRVYQAQENRYKATGILTARSEHQLDQDPYFVYDTIYTDGFPWNTITETGKYVPQFAAISLKAALGMWVVWKSDYTDKLYEAIVKQNEPDKGYYEAVLENGKGPIKAFTANNNGIMLESLLFKANGTFLKKDSTRQGLWEKSRANPYGTEVRADFKNAPAQPLGCVAGENGAMKC